MSYYASHEIIVQEQDGGGYTATERGADRVGEGESPPKAIADYAAQFVDGDEVVTDG